MSSRSDVLVEIDAERDRQDKKWGEQNHPDGTGINWVNQITPAFGWKDNASEHTADLAKLLTNRAARMGKGTWLNILLEEVAEAFAETDTDKLRSELIQVAAVAAQWVEAIDRRQKGD